MGERVRGDLHVQTVNSRHSRLKDFLRPLRHPLSGSWFHLVGLAPGAKTAGLDDQRLYLGSVQLLSRKPIKPK